MLFYERAIAPGSVGHPQPLWRCRCGVERLVRVDGVVRAQTAPRLSPAAELKIAGLRELRQTLAAIRARAMEQRQRAVTLRERTRAALAEAQTIIAISAIALDDGARQLAANGTACALTGYSEGELVRMNLRGLKGSQWDSRTDREWRQFLSRGHLAGACVLRRKTGELITVRFAAAAHVFPGVHIAAMAPRDRLAIPA